jgi:Tfp pilus assembly protein PilE
MKHTKLTLLWLILAFIGFSFHTNAQTTEDALPPVVSTFDFKTLEKLQSAGLLPESTPMRRRKHDKRPRAKFPIEVGSEPPMSPSEFLAPSAFGPSPNPNVNFLGLGDPNTSIPPDVNGAVGPSHVVTTLNTEVKIQDRTGNQLSKVSLSTFTGNSDCFDPKILYDPYNNRWIFTACLDGDLATSALQIAVSTTNDPTGTWKRYNFPINTATSTVWFDYPSIGFNKDWIVVSGNIFNLTSATPSGSFQGTRTFVVNKANVYAASTTPSSYAINSPSSQAFTLTPAITYDNTLTSVYLLEEWNAGAGQLALWQITGVPPTAPTLTLRTLRPTGAAYSDDPTNAQNQQLGSVNTIESNDSRMQQVVYRNGFLWATHSAYLPAITPTRSVVQWWQINPTSTSNTGSVIQFGVVDGGTGVNAPTYCFPSIAVNSRNDVMLGFSKFGKTQYASAGYAIRYASETANTMRTDVTYKAGTASYYKTFSGSGNRWGDYTSTQVDPTNDRDFWTLQEYATTASGGFDRWGTWWANVVAPNIVANNLGVTSLCPGGNTTVSFTTTGTFDAGNTYTVQLSNSSGSFTTPTNIGSGSTSPISVTIPLSTTAGTGYKIQVVSSAPVMTSNSTSAFTVNANPTPTATGGAFCLGSAINLASSGGTTYSWSGPNAYASTLQNPLIANSTSINQGVYAVVVQNINSCSASATAIVVVNPVPTATASISTVCLGGNINLTSAGGVTYSWTGPSTFTSTSQNPIIPNSTLSNQGVYSVVVKNANNCTASATTSLSINGLPTTSGSTVCVNGNINLAVSTANSYSWTGPNSFTSTIRTPVLLNASPSNQGTYTANVTFLNGCTATATASVTVNALPIPTATGGAVCLGTSINLSGSGGVSYSWTGVNSFTSTFQNPVIPNSSLSNQGAYNLTVTNVNGCTATTATTVIINILPTATATNVITCLGSTVNLLSGGGTTYSWSGPSGYTSTAQNPIILNSTNANQGTYIVIVSNLNGCTASSTASVFLNPLPIPTTTGDAVCDDGTAILLASGGVSYSWSGPNSFTSTAQNITITNVSPSITGTYQVTITNANNCSVTANVVLAISNSSNIIESIAATGNWEDASSWNCNRVPTALDFVKIRNGHTITVTTNTAKAKDIFINSGGNVNYLEGAKVDLSH